MKLERSMRRVREVITRPENFYLVTGLDRLEDYTPNLNAIYFAVGDGLVIYEPKDGCCIEMHTAVKGSDLPKRPIKGLHEQWNFLKSLGFYKVYSFAQTHRARLMCRAAGMNLYDRETNLYERVI